MWPFRQRNDEDFRREIEAHLAIEADRLMDDGLSPAQAREAAARRFGSVTAARERFYESRRALWLEQLRQDIRFGCRILTRSPGLSATAVILIALVIGGNTTVFSMAHGILSKPAPGVQATGLVTVSWVNETGQVETHAPYRVYAHLFQHSRTLRPLSAFDSDRVTATHANGSYAVRVGIVSPGYFDTLGVRLVKGRGFTAEEATRGSAGLVVVIAHHLWQNAFDGRDDIAGQPLVLNGQPATVIGVADPAFRGAWLAELADVWVPLAGEFRDWLQPNRSGVSVAMFGRRAPGVSLSESQAELSILWKQLQRADPDVDQRVNIRLVPYSVTAGGNSIIAMRGQRMLAIFSVVTILTLAIVCANVANLLIARAVLRQREVALRQSLGASRARIVRSLLAEALVLSIVAWIAACLFAWFVSKSVISWLAPSAQAALAMPSLAPDWTVVGYALLLAILCTCGVTLGPALRTWRVPLLPSLKVGEPGVVPARSRLSRGLVVLQLAFSVLLLTSAGLAQRSLLLQESLDVGFDTGNILLVTINTAGSATSPAGNEALLETLSARLTRLPGVQSLSYAPGGRFRPWVNFPVRREPAAPRLLTADKRVSAGYFATLGVPLIAGRDFAVTGHEGAEGGGRVLPSAIVSRDLAEALWPGESAIGKTVLAGPDDRLVQAEVIGVVRDAYFSGRGSDARPRYIFFAAGERTSPPGETTFHVRHAGHQEMLAPAIARALREIDSRVAIANVRSLESELAADAAPIWLLTMLLTIFAGGSLLIAAIGQYAVMAFDGRRRSREFGLRIALGATSGQLIASVMSESVRLTALGLLIGFALSLGVAMALSRVLYGITPTDPPTYLGVFAMLAAASLLACYLPARRAARTDPIVALRTE